MHLTETLVEAFYVDETTIPLVYITLNNANMKKNPSELLNLLFISTLIVPTIKNEAIKKLN